LSFVSSGVARRRRRRGTKLRENNLRMTHKKYYEIHAVNSDKAIDLYICFTG